MWWGFGNSVGQANELKVNINANWEFWWLLQTTWFSFCVWWHCIPYRQSEWCIVLNFGTFGTGLTWKESGRALQIVCKEAYVCPSKVKTGRTSYEALWTLSDKLAVLWQQQGIAEVAHPIESYLWFLQFRVWTPRGLLCINAFIQSIWRKRPRSPPISDLCVKREPEPRTCHPNKLRCMLRP